MKKLLLTGVFGFLLAWVAGAHSGQRLAGVDSDLDGVPDSEDWCLGTARGERTGPDGCGAAEIGNWSDTSPCASDDDGSHAAGLDGDRDGMPDSEDWCPDSPDGARIGANGCAPGEIRVSCKPSAAAEPVEKPQPLRVVPASRDNDSDGDGVPNDDDRCPGTARGIPVDRKGCALIEKVVLKGVNFDTGSAKLKPAASGTLRSVASAMTASPKLEVEVGGHTDSVGEEQKNQTLSKRRAESVKAFLVKEGVAAGRISAKGYGESDPVDSNDTVEGRANNRRVGFKVTGD